MHCLNQLFTNFMNTAEKADVSLKPILAALCGLFGLTSIQENAGPFLQFGYFKPTHIAAIDQKVLVHRLDHEY